MRRKIFAYFGILIVLLAFGAPSGGLIDLPVSFFLKNKLHLQASELANFRLVVPVGNSILLTTDIESGDAPALWERFVA
jgi:hypothetical protein